MGQQVNPAVSFGFKNNLPLLVVYNYEQPPARIRFATSRWRLSQH